MMISPRPLSSLIPYTGPTDSIGVISFRYRPIGINITLLLNFCGLRINLSDASIAIKIPIFIRTPVLFVKLNPDAVRRSTLDSLPYLTTRTNIS